MVNKTLFAEVHHIVSLKGPASEDLHLHECEEVFLVLVKTCKAEQDGYGHWRFSNFGRLEFVDLATIKCTVGRVYRRGTWYILDRNGEVSR